MNQSTLEPEVIRWIRLKRNLGFTGLPAPLPSISQEVISSGESQHVLVFPWGITWGLWEILSNSGWESLRCLRRPSVRLGDIVSQGGVQQFVWRELILEPDLPGRQSWLCLSGAVRHWAVPSPL